MPDGGPLDAGAGASPDLDVDASLRAVLDYANSLLDLTVEDRRVALLAFVQARPEFVLSGSNDDGVWALFSNGYPLMILENRAPNADPSAVEKPIEGLLGTEVPKGTRARLVNNMGNAFIDETKALVPLLRSKDYSVVKDPGSVDSLRRLSGDGVFYFSTHGTTCHVFVYDDKGERMIGSDGKEMTAEPYCMWTSTKYTGVRPDPYEEDLKRGVLGYGIARHNFSADKRTLPFETHYWIAEAWATQWSFGPNALVWLSACGSLSPVASGFATLSLDHNAGLVVGWTSSMWDAAGSLTSKFVIDRLLGANLSSPKEDPPQRPFDYESVWADLRSRGLHVHPADTAGHTTELQYRARGLFGLLAPSIAYVLVDEANDQAILKGLFGEPPEGERSVTIGGERAQVQKWEKDTIRVDLKRNGTGSSGDVVVTVRGHQSNVRRISEWTVQLTYTLTQTDTLQVTGPVTIRLRADVGEYREAAGKAPKKPVRYAYNTRDSQAFLTASGTTGGPGCTTTWSGSSAVAARGYGWESTSPTVQGLARFDVATRRVALGTNLGDTGIFPWKLTVACPDKDAMSAPLAPFFGFLDGKVVTYLNPADETKEGPTLYSFDWALDESWGIPGGTSIEPFGSFEVRFTWDPAPAKSPPDAAAAR